MSDLLDKPTNKFYGSLFNKDTTLGKWNRFVDPVTTKIADDAVEKTTPITDADVPIEAPVTMPGSDDEAVRRARRRKIASMQARSGRQSTLMSGGDGDVKLGG